MNRKPIMNTRTITINVSDRAAQVYEKASEEMKRKLDVLLSARLLEATHNDRSLEEIMDELSRKAQSRGLTEEKLDELLNA